MQLGARWLSLSAFALVAPGIGCGREPGPAPVTSTSSSSAAPEIAPRGDDAIDVAMGDEHACRLLRSGRVECWGDNLAGQLGDGSHVDRPTPGAVRAIEDAVAITAKADGTCAARRDGSVWCWGRHPAWSEPGSSDRTAPAPIEGRAGVVQLSLTAGALLTIDALGRLRGAGDPAAATPASAGQELTCAVAKGGLVTCSGEDGQPRFIEGIDDAVKVAVGRHAACALRRTGDVACWGDGPTGVRGKGSTSLYRTPVEVRGLPPIAQIASTSLEHFALADDGRLFHWGSPAPRRPADRQRSARGPELEPIEPVARIFGSRGEACALLKSGALVCKHSTPWGHDPEGLFADVVGPWEPVDIPDVAALAGVWPTFAEIDGEEHFTDDHWVAVQGSGKVLVWVSTGEGRSAPRALRGVRDATSVGVSGDRACVTLAGGKAICWHHRFVGRDAEGSAPDVSLPLVTVPGLRDAVSAEGPCFVRRTGETACFGMALGGARMVPFGLDEVRAWLRPAWGSLCVFYPSQSQLACHGELLAFKDTAPADAISATFSQRATCVLRKDRKVACWGDNRSGEVGQLAPWATEPATPVARSP